MGSPGISGLFPKFPRTILPLIPVSRLRRGSFPTRGIVSTDDHARPIVHGSSNPHGQKKMMQLPGRFLPLQAIKCRAAGQGRMGLRRGRAPKHGRDGARPSMGKPLVGHGPSWPLEMEGHALAWPQKQHGRDGARPSREKPVEGHGPSWPLEMEGHALSWPQESICRSTRVRFRPRPRRTRRSASLHGCGRVRIRHPVEGHALAWPQESICRSTRVRLRWRASPRKCIPDDRKRRKKSPGCPGPCLGRACPPWAGSGPALLRRILPGRPLSARCSGL